jgi:hypothetical protein
MSGRWKQSMADIVWHHRETRWQTEKTNLGLNRCATSRLYNPVSAFFQSSHNLGFQILRKLGFRILIENQECVQKQPLATAKLVPDSTTGVAGRHLPEIPPGDSRLGLECYNIQIAGRKVPWLSM